MSSNDDSIRRSNYNDSDTTSVTIDQTKLIQLLDKSKTWNKDTLESLGLSGLFDDMVYYKFSSIVDLDTNIVNKSTKMRELIRVATEAKNKKATPLEPTYNYNTEKNTIDIDAYINRVNKFIKEHDNYQDSNESGDDGNSDNSNSQGSIDQERHHSGGVKPSNGNSNNTGKPDNDGTNSIGR